MEITCPNCGSIYEIRRIKIPVRDKDTITCDVCNQTLKSWNGGEMWVSDLKERKENHKNDASTEKEE